MAISKLFIKKHNLFNNKNINCNILLPFSVFVVCIGDQDCKNRLFVCSSFIVFHPKQLDMLSIISRCLCV